MVIRLGSLMKATTLPSPWMGFVLFRGRVELPRSEAPTPEQPFLNSGCLGQNLDNVVYPLMASP